MATPWSIPATSGFFGSTNASLNFTTPTTDFSKPAASYTSAYNAARDLNQQMYSNQLAGHAERLSNYQAANASLMSGYRGLQRQVMRRLAGTNRANLQDIADSYTALSGQQSQQLIDRGLGNTTVQSAVLRGLAADHAKEATRSRGNFAQLMASQIGQIGSARLAAQERGMNFMSGLQADRLGMMERVSAPYPDPGMYAQLAMAGGSKSPWGGGVFGSAAGIPGMPGPALGTGRGAGGGYYDMGGDYAGGYDAMPSSGVNLYSGYSGLGGYSGTGYAVAEPAGVVSGYGRGDPYNGGPLTESYATSPQYGGNYAGAYAAREATGYY